MKNFCVFLLGFRFTFSLSIRCSTYHPFTAPACFGRIPFSYICTWRWVAILKLMTLLDHPSPGSISHGLDHGQGYGYYVAASKCLWRHLHQHILAFGIRPREDQVTNFCVGGILQAPFGCFCMGCPCFKPKNLPVMHVS